MAKTTDGKLKRKLHPGGKMKLSRLLIWSATAGAFTPIILHIIWRLDNNMLLLSNSAKIILQKITLALWPSSFFMLAASGDEPYLLSVLANIALYGILGIGIYYGLTKHWLILIFPILGTCLIWWGLFSLK
jgi:hypothetical protein